MSWSGQNWWEPLFSWVVGAKSRLQKSPNKPSRRRLELELLEARTLLSGTWTALANLSPDPPKGAQALMLLSNGTAMVQGGQSGSDAASKDWYGLKPDATGSYINGTWSTLKPMGLERLFFTSDMLPSGKVFIVGGEYSGPSTAQNETNTGEIYDPVANTWSNIPNVPTPGGDFGDGSTEVLPDGRVLAGYLAGPQTYFYNPTTNTWANGPAKLRNDATAEETWVKLPDSSILTYEIQGTKPQTAQRYVPSLNQWVDAGTVPVALESDGGNNGIVPELGPALLLPDGRVFFIGASGNTALYTPSATLLGTGSWAKGPVIPNSLGAFDTPGAIMPNGSVLFVAGVIDGNNFPPPTSIFEYDPVANTISAASAPPAPLANVLKNTPAFLMRLMVLPSGQVLLGDATNQLWVYTPNGAPQNAWRPTITNVAPNGGNIFTMTGTQLNGISEGSTYGDDAENATNYPIVRITAGGVVTYARTFNWSSTGVATGITPVTTQFALPAGFVLGNNDSIVVIANGIPSVSFTLSQNQNQNQNQNLTKIVQLYFPLRYTYSAGIFSGYLTLNNIGTASVGPFTLVFPSLPSGVTLANATGSTGGHPSIAVAGTMGAHSSQRIFIQLRNPKNVPLGSFFVGLQISVISG